jgi:hypothetical protein
MRNDDATLNARLEVKETFMETANTPERPQSVRTAMNCLWLSVAIGAVKLLMELPYLKTIAPAPFTDFVLIVVFALMVFLIFRIYAGKNWARVTFLVLFVIGILPTLPTMQSEFVRSPLLGTLSIVQAGLQIYALFLLFSKPGSGWFRKAAAA